MTGLWERIRERNADTDPIIEGAESPLQEAAKDIPGNTNGSKNQTQPQDDYLSILVA